MSSIIGVVTNISDEYIMIEELDKKLFYNIPRNQIKKEIILNERLIFYKEYNVKHAKFYLSLERDDYKIDGLYNFKIKKYEIREFNGNTKNYFIVEDSNGNEYAVPSFYWQTADNTKVYLQCKVNGYNRDRLRLVNTDYSHPHYTVGLTYNFQICDFLDSELPDGCNKIILNDHDKNSILVTAFGWQKKELWTFPDIICEVCKFNERGIPVLINRDNRHPVYELQKEYLFKIIATKQKIDVNDPKKTWDVLVLLGDDGCIHETNAYTGQIQDVTINETIKCEIVSISHRVKLKQILQVDPYFEEIINIVKEERFLKYTDLALNSSESNCQVFKEQCYSKRSFWVLTFCNKILPVYLKNSLESKNYNEAFEVSELLMLLEDYILNGKILQSFPNDDYRRVTSIKASIKIEEYSMNLKCIRIIRDSEITEYLKGITEKNLDELAFFLRHCDEELIKNNDIVLHLIGIISRINNTDKKTEIILYHLDKYLSYRKRSLYNNNQQINIIAKIDSIFKNREDQDYYFQWTYCQFLINVLMLNYERSSYLAGKILRLYFFVTDDYREKKKSLYNAYYLLTHESVELQQVFEFNDNLKINFKKLEDNPNLSIANIDAWRYIKKSSYENSSFLVNVRKKHYDGFEVSYQGIIGFLPVHHITDGRLKNYHLPEIDFTISVKCILFSEEFNFFVVKQLDRDSLEFVSTNNLYFDPIEGCTIEGVVKSVTTYGIFISTLSGDGLIHKSEISEHYWDEEKLKDFFKVGEKIFAVVIEFDKENKRLNLSLKQLIGTSHDSYYKDLLNRRDFQYFYDEEKETVDNNVEGKNISLQQIQIERAFCFEQYALLQIDLDSKVRYLRIAKQFYSTINSARSYLINLYTEYFELIEHLNFNFNLNLNENLNEVKNQAIGLKNRIQQQTMDTFPDVKKLNDFLLVLSLFNEITENSFNKLISLLQTETGTVLTIVKITLANNLMVSETKEGSDFSIKNLRLLKTYLDNGILTLDETQSDKHEREIKEKMNYWKGKISENESENLEFKSSFKTPIRDKVNIEKLKQIDLKLQKNPTNENLTREKDRIDGVLAQKAIMHSSFKTLAAFANTNGGTLLIGVADNQTIVGLEVDYNSLKESNRDGFGKFFDSKIKEYFEESFSSLLDREFIRFPNGDILVISVRPSLDPVFLLKDKDGNNNEQLFVRELTTTKEISQKKELVKFIKIRLQKQLREKIIE